MLNFLKLVCGFYTLQFGGGGGSSSAPAQQTVTNNTTPWAGQQPYLSEVFDLAQKLNNAPGPAYYPGQVTASPDVYTQAAQRVAGQAAEKQGQLADTTMASNTFNMTAGRDVKSNPYLQSAIDAAIRPVTAQFTDAGGVLNQTRDAATQAGQFGGSRHGIAEGLASKAYLDKVGDISSTMASRGYETGLTNATQAAALTPQTQQALQAPAATYDAIGQQRNAYTQATIDDAINKWNYEQNLPGAKLAQYQNLVQGNYGGTSSGLSTSTSGARSGGGLTGILGGAAAGASLAGALGLSAGWGAAGGALLALI